MIHGRERERKMISSLIARAWAGTSGVLVVRGEPGVGKTALLDDAIASSPGMAVLSCRAVESEAALPFGGLHQLLAPVLAHLDALPDTQAAALGGALDGALGGVLESSPPAAPDFLLGAAVLTLLTEAAARRGPLLVIIDDAQWLDEESADALGFTLRRLTTAPIAVLVGLRDPSPSDPSPGALGPLPELWLTGLDQAAAAALLAERGWQTPAPVRTAAVQVTGGNPLALIELTVAGPPEQLTEDLAIGLTVPLHARLRTAFTHQADGLPAETRALLLVAAAEETGRQEVVLSAGQLLGLAAAALAPAEQARLVRVGAGTIRFRHPLLRAALYQEATFTERAAVHRAIADALTDRAQPELATWHHALAAPGPDEQLATALESNAETIEHRNGSMAAAAALHRAARLSESAPGRGRRLAAAAQAAWRSGQGDLARTLTDGLSAEPADAHTEARMARLRGLIELGSGDPAAAAAQLEYGAKAVADTTPAEAAALLMLAVDAAYHAGAEAEAIRLATAIAELSDDQQIQLLGHWLVDALQGRLPVEGTEPWSLVDAMPDQLELQSYLRYIWAMAVSAFGPHQPLAREFGVRICATQRRAGMVGTMSISLNWLAEVEFHLGMWSDGQAHAEDALFFATETGQHSRAADALALLARFAAVRDEPKQCRELATKALAAALPLRNRAAAANAAWALALTALADTDTDEAYAQLTKVNTSDTPYSHAYITRLAAPDLVEAAVRSERFDLARQVTEALSRWSRQTTLPWVRAHLLRCEALLADDDSADELFRTAMAMGDGAHRPFDQARTALVWGEWLRRSRKRTEARMQLQFAAELFESLGGQRWAANAWAQLPEAGRIGGSRTETPATALLTPQERQIAQLAAGGLSNKEIGAQLFLSPRTVGYHLYNLFPKLGISARSQLRDMDFGDPATRAE